jgi:hypothetical protein
MNTLLQLPTAEQRDAERMLKWFVFQHIPDVQAINEPWHRLALHVVATIGPSAKRTVALRKLLEGRDAAVRAAL